MKVVQSIEDVLMEKIIFQKQVISNFREIDHLNGINQMDTKIQMGQIFEDIETCTGKMLELDLRFTNYFEQYKRVTGIKSLEELDRNQQKSFTLIQQLVAKVNSLQDQINNLKDHWAEEDSSIRRIIAETRQKQKATAAYKNINKL
ncbi:MAG: hypothetical protein BGO41_06400 [Clostridiales bacterium 38-18]|nr:MAG: hypothetical protein BGO41_06400 [Clostridiales bacterium 38-18]